MSQSHRKVTKFKTISRPCQDVEIISVSFRLWKLASLSQFSRKPFRCYFCSCALLSLKLPQRYHRLKGLLWYVIKWKRRLRIILVSKCDDQGSVAAGRGGVMSIGPDTINFYGTLKNYKNNFYYKGPQILIKTFSPPKKSRRYEKFWLFILNKFILKWFSMMKKNSNHHQTRNGMKYLLLTQLVFQIKTL